MLIYNNKQSQTLQGVAGLAPSDKLKALINELDWTQLPINPLKICREFCNVNFEGRLLAIGEELELSEWKGLASQWDIWPDSIPCQIRLDKKMVLFLLSSALGHGHSDSQFSCNNLTEVEREILEALLQELIEHCTQYLQGNGLNPRNEAWTGKRVHLIWGINTGEEISKIAFSLPVERIPTHYGIVESHPLRSAENCAEVTIRCNLLVGSSTLTLSDLLKLEADDFLLLESSDTSCFQVTGEDGLLYAIPLVIGVRKNESRWHKIKLSDDKIKEIKKMNQVLNNDVLSDFPVEVKVEFREVKMTLKDLFALQSGWVLPIDQVIDNQLFLTSQGKTIAKGELVVAGNKFGILIKEVLLNANQTQ